MTTYIELLKGKKVFDDGSLFAKFRCQDGSGPHCQRKAALTQSFLLRMQLVVKLRAAYIGS